jgi:hypothetical protein
MVNTFRRDKLRRLAAAGKLVMVDSYRYDDGYGADRSTKELPVRMSTSDVAEYADGVCTLRPYHFTGKSGCAYSSAPGKVTLIVHSNLNFTFRILDQAAV